MNIDFTKVNLKFQMAKPRRILDSAGAVGCNNCGYETLATWRALGAFHRLRHFSRGRGGGGKQNTSFLLRRGVEQHTM